MSSTLVLETAPAGARLVDMGAILDAAGYQALRQAGVWGVLIDVATEGAAAGIERARAAGLRVGVWQGYDPQAFLQPEAAVQRAAWALTVLHAAGVLVPGLTLAVDWEAVPALPIAAAIGWLNSWSARVVQAGLVAGIYVGAGQPLNGGELYQALVHITRYWEGCSQNLPAVATRGYCLVQRACNQWIGGQEVDLDEAHPDALGGQWTFLPPLNAAPPPTVTTQSYAPETQVTVLEARIATLESALRQAGSALKGVGA